MNEYRCYTGSKIQKSWNFEISVFKIIKIGILLDQSGAESFEGTFKPIIHTSWIFVIWVFKNNKIGIVLDQSGAE